MLSPVILQCVFAHVRLQSIHGIRGRLQLKFCRDSDRTRRRFPLSLVCPLKSSKKRSAKPSSWDNGCGNC
uniref:Fe-superoxide dismutase n=1 Tax=Rhizophora mucronata TaxID=61149 RepID=A0A2P2K4A1_RHIMU